MFKNHEEFIAAQKVSHVGRSWSGHSMEDECPCPQEVCGLVQMNKADANCPQHALGTAKTMRQIHSPEKCEELIKSS